VFGRVLSDNANVADAGTWFFQRGVACNVELVLRLYLLQSWIFVGAVSWLEAHLWAGTRRRAADWRPLARQACAIRKSHSRFGEVATWI
jgi:hypothetical protein